MRTLLLFIGLAILTTAVHAQSKQVKGPERTWVMINDTVVGDLSLTAGQQRMLRDMELRYQENLDSIQAREEELGSEEVQRRIATLSQGREREIQMIMNPQQYRQWADLRSTRAKATVPVK